MQHKTLITALSLLMLTAWAGAPRSAQERPTDDAVPSRLTQVQTDAEGAQAEPAEEIKGSAKKGKYYFKKLCKDCHGKKDVGGELTPISKTIKQWERFFKKGIHFEEQPVDSLASAAELIHIETFLVAHAADSDQPETCK